MQLCNVAGPRLIGLDRLDIYLLEAEELYNIAKASSDLLEVGLYTDISIG